ncbi:MAG: asparaginase, partial [Chloroflexota bacterium]|nr:asparaginase [Chloroflexota bacterium]
MATVLLEVTRGAVVESRHYGAIAVVDADGALRAHAGDPGLVTYLRSAAKPLQALPLVASGAAARFAFTGEELAVCAASHSGEPAHRAAVAGLLARLGLDPSALRCGVIPPIDRAEAARVVAGVLPPGPLYNDCSGKHAAMLATCLHRGWPLDGYLDPDHPLQREILGVMSALLDLPERAIPIAVDGCGVPTFAAPLANLAGAWARLAAPVGPYAEAARPVLDAMAAHPFMVAGSGRLCTDLMESAGGRVVAKVGAEGVLCLGLRERGWGVAVKIADGGSRALPAVAASVLAQLGALDDAALARFTARQQPVVWNKDRAWGPTGELRPVFTLQGVRRGG